MGDVNVSDAPAMQIDLGEYCRQIEDFLTQVNSGNLVRVVGPAFELVRSWAIAGVPLSIVFEGVRAKAVRHQAGTSRRPLRLEFCAEDVQEVFDRWRRAVGAFGPVTETDQSQPPAKGHRPQSLSRHLDRVIERLVSAASRVDVSPDLRNAIERSLDRLTDIRGRSERVRGEKRAAILEELAEVDRHLLDEVRAALEVSTISGFADSAGEDIRAFRSRLTPDAWERSVSLGIDRLVRERCGLPTVELDA
jgi:hypothetical protein